MKRYNIAVLGSANKKLNEKIYKIAYETGKEIAQKGHILITGAATGISEIAAKGAKENDGLVIGISPSSKRQEIKQFNISEKNIDSIIHTGMGYKGRNIITVRSSDAVIIINGQFGTLNEASIAEGEEKPIVAISGSGGCADILQSIFRKIKPEYKYFSTATDPKKAIKKAINLIQKYE